MRLLPLILLTKLLCSTLTSKAVDSALTIEPETLRRRYKPTWQDLDSRPLPQWYDEAKIGIFLHWGVYSVPGFHRSTEWFWANWKSSKIVKKFMSDNYPPGFTYQDFAPQFTAEFFNATQWAVMFKKAGAKYVVLTSKHHDGFTLFPSKRSSSWNSKDVGPNRDLVGELSKSVRKQKLKFGVYHSLYEWYNPIYLEDSARKFSTRVYPETKLWPDIKQLIKDYEPSILWADGDWPAYETYWNSTELIAWLYNDSPVREEIVVNDRWGKNITCKHGDFLNCADNYKPGHILDHKWESAFKLDTVSWGYRRNMESSSVMTIGALLERVVSTVSCGGNALINVGPTKEGTINPLFQERLAQLGEWLQINGEAIYKSSPWFHQKDKHDKHVWYTCTKTPFNATHPTSVPSKTDNVTAIYAIFLKWPHHNLLKISDIVPVLQSDKYRVLLLGMKGVLNWKIENRFALINLPDKSVVTLENAWTLKFSRK